MLKYEDMRKSFYIKNFLFFGLLFGIFCLPQITKAGVIPQPPNSLGLVGYWSFEGTQDNTTAHDFSGNGNTGTLNGSMDSADYVTGYKTGSTALDLDGSDDYVSVADDNSLDLTSSITLSAWVNLDTLPTIILLIHYHQQ